MDSNNSPNPDSPAAPDLALFSARFETLCAGLFATSGDWRQIAAWQKELQLVSSDPRYFHIVSSILLNSRSASTTFFASAVLSTHVRRFGKLLSLPVVSELSTRLFKLVLENPKGVWTDRSVYQLLSGLLKCIWFEPEFGAAKSLLEMLVSGLSTAGEQAFVLLDTIIDEMQSPDTRVSATHRRVYYSFECKYLGHIVKECVTILAGLQVTEESLPRLQSVLQTLRNCLRYSFQSGKEDDTCDFYVSPS